MPRDLPTSTPEGLLIRRVRESLRPRVSIPEAARRAEIGESTWGNVERGYKTTGRGSEPVPVKPSSKILAHMAYSIGVTPTDLERVGRADAAEVLREMQGPEPEVMPEPADEGAVVLIPIPPDMSEEERDELRQWGVQMAKYLQERRKSGK